MSVSSEQEETYLPPEPEPDQGALLNISQSPHGLYADPYYVCVHQLTSGPEMEAGHYIRLIVFPLLLLCGIVGNLLAFPVLYSIGRSAWSTVWYLMLLALTDLVILLVRCGDTWYSEVMEESLSAMITGSSDAACKTYTFAFMFIKHLSPWLLVAVAVEMTIASRWPRRTYVMCSLERARNVVMLLTILVVCLDINHFWTWSKPQPEVGCMYTEEFSQSFMAWYWPVLDNMTELFLPLVLVSACFFLTATAMIRRTAAEEKAVATEMSKYFLELPTLCDFRTICLVLCLVFMCLATFTATLNITDFLFMRGFFKLDCKAVDRFSNTITLLKTLDMTFTFAFYSFKIFLYLAMSKTFRARLHSGFFSALRGVRSGCCGGGFCRFWCGYDVCAECRPGRREWTPVPSTSAGGSGEEGLRPSSSNQGITEEELGDSFMNQANGRHPSEELTGGVASVKRLEGTTTIHAGNNVEQMERLDMDYIGTNV
ncbi:CX3C chemokine receptor 1 isoform X2 [Aplysia californica]|nr:CX3C chemokine receptor 1 isoform X2 [Aplysia californica]